MTVYNVCNDYSLEIATKSEIETMKNKVGLIKTTGRVNFKPCIYWKNRFHEVIALETHDAKLDGYVLGTLKGIRGA